MSKIIGERDRRVLRLKKELDKAIRSYRERVGNEHWNLELLLLREVGAKRELSKKDLKSITYWKLGNRHKDQVGKNMERDVRRWTKLAFHERDVKEKLRILCRLKGVGIRTASAVLMFHNPGRYTMTDDQAWTALHKFGFLNSPPSHYSPGRYVEYLDVCRQLSKALSIGLRRLDRGLWVLGGD